MNILRKLADFLFGGTAGSVPPSLINPSSRLIQRHPLTDEQVDTALIIWNSLIHAVKFKANGVGRWGQLGYKVKVDSEFAGWSYVSGRNEGIKLHPRIHLVEADDDMGFSEVCLLVDRVPVLLSEVNGGGHAIRILSPSTDSPIGILPWYGTISCKDSREFKTLPEPVQVVLSHLWKFVLDLESQRVADPREVLLKATMGDS